MDAHALHRRGWTISAIARHLGQDRKTIRAYLSGGRVAGQRRRAEPDPFEPFAGYCRERLGEDPHLWATTLFDEVLELGYDRSYPTFTRQLRARGLRPACEPCRPAQDRPVAVIEHPPGDETQWDWVELPDPPEHWGWGSEACLLVGALAHSGRWRGGLSASMDQPHLIQGLDRVSGALGGLTRAGGSTGWPPSCTRGPAQVSASFAAMAKHYGVSGAACPPRRGNRKGVVEKANHTAATARSAPAPRPAETPSIPSPSVRAGQATPTSRTGTPTRAGARSSPPAGHGAGRQGSHAGRSPRARSWRVNVG